MCVCVEILRLKCVYGNREIRADNLYLKCVCLSVCVCVCGNPVETKKKNTKILKFNTQKY